MNLDIRGGGGVNVFSSPNRLLPHSYLPLIGQAARVLPCPSKKKQFSREWKGIKWLIWYHKLRKTFSKFYRRYYGLIPKSTDSNLHDPH